MAKSLDPEPNFDARDDRDEKSVQSALKVIEDCKDQKSERDGMNKSIQDLFEEGFEVSNPSGTKKITSQTLQQAIWRTASKMKPLDFVVHGSGRPEENEKVVTSGISTVMDKGGYTRALRDKEGGFQKLISYGDGFIHVGTDDNSPYPIKFNPISNSNLYTDPYSTGIRSGGIGRRSTKMTAIFSMPWARAIKQYPKLKKIGGKGKIPREMGYGKELERDYFQTPKLHDLVEIAYSYDIDNLNHTIFAGQGCSIIKEEKKDNYPFIMDNEPYIPILQFICMPSSEGFWNYGIGNMLYKLAIITRRLMNMAINHCEENTWPITMVNVPKGEAGKFFNNLQLAHEMRAVGKRGYVANEYNPLNPAASQVNAESLITGSLVNEWQIIFDRLDREISRLGINLDDIERGANVTASQIIAEEEAANAFVKQIMEYNASESEFAINLTMDFMKKFVDSLDTTPINLTTKIPVEGAGEEIRMDNITMGAIADELRKFNYFVKVNARTGAYPSNIMQQAQIERMIEVTPPNSQAFYKLISQLASLYDRDLPLESFIQQMSAKPGAETMSPPEPTQTEKIRPTPFAKEAAI